MSADEALAFVAHITSGKGAVHFETKLGAGLVPKPDDFTSEKPEALERARDFISLLDAYTTKLSQLVNRAGEDAEKRYIPGLAPEGLGAGQLMRGSAPTPHSASPRGSQGPSLPRDVSEDPNIDEPQEDPFLEEGEVVPLRVEDVPEEFEESFLPEEPEPRTTTNAPVPVTNTPAPRLHNAAPELGQKPAPFTPGVRTRRQR